MMNMLETWGPKILGAIAILVIAYFVAKAVKWALGKAIDKVPGASKHNEGRDPKESLGAQLGGLGFWLVLLIGLIAALSVLQLPGSQNVVGPLNTLVTDIVGFIPNLIGAVLIFFIGYIVATLARRVVEAALGAAQVDRWLEKAGVGRMTGASGLAKAAGTIVFVLIIIPAAIAALQQLHIRAISDPAVSVLSTVLDALPRLIGAAVLLAIVFVIARWVAGLIEQILGSLGFDRTIGSLTGMDTEGSGAPSTSTMGASPSANAVDPGAAAYTAPESVSPAGAAGGGRMSPSKIVGQIALWAIMIFAAVEAARLLNFAAISEMLQQILELGASVLFGAVIIVVGVFIAQFLANMINKSTGGRDGFASTIVRWATIALATAMGLRFMGIADEIVILAFGLILGSAAVAAALAFGLGGREAAGRLADRWARKAEQQGGGTPPTPGI